MKSQTGQEATMPRRAYSYARFSQGTQGQGDSERRQTEWAAVISGEQGWQLDDTLQFIDRGKSGFHGANRKATAALNKFLGMVERGRIAKGSVLIVEQIDRLSRQDVDTAHDLFRSIIRAGVWICTRVPFRVYKGEKDASFMDLLEPIWIMYCAYMESLKKSQRVAEAWEVARREARTSRKPLGTQPPAWLRREGDGYVKVPARVATLGRLKEMVLGGKGSGEIAARMAEEGVPALGRSGRWNGSAVYQLLTSRTLVGEYQPGKRVDGKRIPNGPPIPGYYPAVWTEAEWQDVRAALSGRRRQRGRPGKARLNVLVGLVWEATGRRKMSLQTAHTHGRAIPYLSWGQIAGTPRLRYDDLEKCVLGAVMMLRPEDVLDPMTRQDDREAKLGELTGRVAALEHRQRQLQAAAADLEQDAGAILPSLALVSSELKAAVKQRDTLQLECRSGRAEALRYTQALVALREETEGEAREELDQRIQGALPGVLESVWVQCQKVSARRQVVHVQIWLRNGECRYPQMPVPDLRGVEPWDLREVSWDLRRGPYVAGREVSDVAAVAEAS